MGAERPLPTLPRKILTYASFITSQKKPWPWPSLAAKGSRANCFDARDLAGDAAGSGPRAHSMGAAGVFRHRAQNLDSGRPADGAQPLFL